MKLALYGATGTIGHRILDEALARGHEVTAIVRDPSRIGARPNLTIVHGDVLDAKSVEERVRGHEAVISAFGPRERPQDLVTAAQTLIEGLTRANVRRLLVVGGAGSLEVAGGVRLVDSPKFPEAWRPAALAHADSLNAYLLADLDWTYLSPAAHIAPGERTGKFRIGGDRLLTDEAGQSTISAEDYAIALMDEVEHPAHVRQRFSVAY